MEHRRTENRRKAQHRLPLQLHQPLRCLRRSRRHLQEQHLLCAARQRRVGRYDFMLVERPPTLRRRCHSAAKQFLRQRPRFGRTRLDRRRRSLHRAGRRHASQRRCGVRSVSRLGTPFSLPQVHHPRRRTGALRPTDQRRVARHRCFPQRRRSATCPPARNRRTENHLFLRRSHLRHPPSHRRRPLLAPHLGQDYPRPLRRSTTPLHGLRVDLRLFAAPTSRRRAHRGLQLQSFRTRFSSQCRTLGSHGHNHLAQRQPPFAAALRQ